MAVTEAPTQAFPATRDEILAEIERVRAEGIPPAGTAERARYIRLFRGLEPDPNPVSGLTEAQQQSIVEDYASSTKTVADIVQEHGISKSTLNTLIKRAGVPHRRSRTRIDALSNAQHAEIIDAYTNTAGTVEEIARAYDIGLNVLYEILERHGIPKRSTRPDFRSGEPVGKGRFVTTEDGGHRWVPVTPTADPEAPAELIELVDQEALASPAPPEESPPMPDHKTAPAAASANNWVDEASARLAADQQRDGLILPPGQHGWAITFVIQRVVTVGTPSIDEAVAAVRKQHGADVDIVSVIRT